MRSLFDSWTGPRAGDRVVCLTDLATDAKLVSASTPVSEIDRIFLSEVTKAQAASFAERTQLSAASPFACEGRRLRVSATIGIAMAEETGESSDLTRLEVLLRNADDAMRAQKQAGTRPARSAIRGGPASPKRS